MTTVEAKKLVLDREADQVGHKRIIYAIDQADRTKEPIRKVITDFFKNKLGFTLDEILVIDISEFKEDRFKNSKAKFSAKT